MNCSKEEESQKRFLTNLYSTKELFGFVFLTFFGTRSELLGLDIILLKTRRKSWQSGASLQRYG